MDWSACSVPLLSCCSQKCPVATVGLNTLQPQTHYGWAAGWGVALKNFVQVDTAVSVGDDATEVVVSMVIRVR
jgi:hypothetical protein